MNYTERKKLIADLIKEDKYPLALVECSKILMSFPNDAEIIEITTFLWNRIVEGNSYLIPENAEDYTLRGISKFYNDEIEESLQDYDAALQLDPKYDFALKCKVFSLRSLNRVDEAIININKAIEISSVGEYFGDLAEIYSEKGDFEKALYFNNIAVTNSPDDPRFWFNYGVDLNMLGQFQDALNKYNKAIELWPNYEDAIVNRMALIDQIGI